jgi:NADPH:quinone reductase-like Zn-dependent oxidoreductase
MRAAVFDQTGPPEVLRVTDLAVPAPGPGQVCVRVHTSGVQPFDALVRSGHLPIALRFPQQIGNEFAGTVVAAGPGTDRRPGDAVLGWAALACHAEQVIADADAIAAVPPTMGWDTAGAIGASGQTALTALRELDLEPGDTLLVHGGAGGAGGAVVQIAHHRGLRVIATAHPDHHQALRGLGALPLSYGPELPERVAELDGRVDAALTVVGGHTLEQSLAMVDDPRRIATLVDHDEAERLGVLGIRAVRSTSQLHELIDLHEAGALRVPLRARFPLTRIVDAHHLVETGHGHGKVLLDLTRPNGEPSQTTLRR